MALLITIVRRSFGWCLGIVDSVRHGEDDLRAVYGDNPNGLTPEQAALQGSVSMNMSNTMSGGLGL